MKKYTKNFIRKVKEARKSEKLSFSELGKIYKVPKHTIGDWCKGIFSNKSEMLKINNERRRKKIKNSGTKIVPSVCSIGKNQAKLFAAVLYGCEGSKYPAHNGMAFANSDPGLVSAFLKLLRKGFVLQEKKLKVHLQIHTTHNFIKVRKFWSKLLSIKEDRFIKPTITPPTGKKHRLNYIGTCTLRYGDYRVQLELLGIFEEFTRKFGR